MCLVTCKHVHPLIRCTPLSVQPLIRVRQKTKMCTATYMCTPLKDFLFWRQKKCVYPPISVSHLKKKCVQPPIVVQAT